MKVNMLLAACAASLALAGCNSADESKPRKGKYKPEVELTKFEFASTQIPESMMPQLQEQMERGFKSSGGTEQCLGGQGEAQWDKMAEGMTKGLGGDCETISSDNTNDTVDNVVKCTGTRMGTVTVSTKGKAESESIDIDFKFEMIGAPMLGDGEMGIKLTAKRTGDC